MKPKEKDAEIIVTRVEQRSIQVFALGINPYIHNRLAEKAKHELLFPKGKKTSGEKASTMKHDPIEEFRRSPYTFSDSTSPTLIGIPAAAMKKAMAGAALDTPGAKKAQIGRLVWVSGERIPIYGTPKLFMRPVRSADMNRTPDIRTRAIMGEWCVPLTIHFAHPVINATTIINLLVAGGMFNGVGDWRQEKGSGSYGQFEVLSREQALKDERVVRLMKQGRAVQTAAMEAASCFDEETAELYEWWNMELRVRGKAASAAA